MSSADRLDADLTDFVEKMAPVQRERILLALSYFSVLRTRTQQPDWGLISELTDVSEARGDSKVVTHFMQGMVYALKRTPEGITEDLLRSSFRSSVFPSLSDSDIGRLIGVYDKVSHDLDGAVAAKVDSPPKLSAEDFVLLKTAEVLTMSGRNVGLPWFSTLGGWDRKKELLRAVALRNGSRFPGANQGLLTEPRQHLG